MELKKLRHLGPVGNFAANVIAALTTNWGLAMSVLSGLIAGSWAVALNFFASPATLVGMWVFLFVLWTYIGITILIDRRKPRVVQIAPDYRYGLTFEGLNPTLDPMSMMTWFNFAVQIRNYSQAPIRYAIDDFDVQIETRRLPKASKKMTGYLPRGGGKTIGASPLRKEDMKEFFGRRVKGIAELSIIYGHPELSPVRRLRINMELTIEFAADGEPPIAWGCDIVGEVDEAYSPPGASS